MRLPTSVCAPPPPPLGESLPTTTHPPTIKKATPHPAPQGGKSAEYVVENTKNAGRQCPFALLGRLAIATAQFAPITIERGQGEEEKARTCFVGSWGWGWGRGSSLDLTLQFQSPPLQASKCSQSKRKQVGSAAVTPRVSDRTWVGRPTLDKGSRAVLDDTGAREQIGPGIERHTPTVGSAHLAPVAQQRHAMGPSLNCSSLLACLPPLVPHSPSADSRYSVALFLWVPLFGSM